MTTKVCKSCSEDKPLSDYFVDKAGREGRRARCKVCESPANKARFMSYPKRDRTDYDRIYRRRWRAANRGRDRANGAAYRARKLQATPTWADMDAIKDVYLEAAYMQLQVDHIIPLQGEKVCGLHVWDNLQLLTAKENQSKNNSFDIG